MKQFKIVMSGLTTLQFGIGADTNAGITNPVYLHDSITHTAHRDAGIEAPVYYMPSYYLSVGKRLMDISMLNENWDGYGAVSIQKQTMEHVIDILDKVKEKYIKLLDEGDIYPSPYGTIDISFEDHHNNSLVIEVGINSYGLSGSVNNQDIIKNNVSFTEDLSDLLVEINRLSVE